MGEVLAHYGPIPGNPESRHLDGKLQKVQGQAAAAPASYAKEKGTLAHELCGKWYPSRFSQNCWSGNKATETQEDAAGLPLRPYSTELTELYFSFQ